MADYREISQEYAKQGINAAFLLNGGAAIGLLSQAAELIQRGMGRAVAPSMLIWSLGTALAAFTWILAFASTRYVDKSEREHNEKVPHLLRSDRLMNAAIIAVFGSIALFVAGCWKLAAAFA